MNEDTINLLKECNAGCKMGTNSMEQLQRFIENEKLKSIIDEYNDKHIKIGDECHKMLKSIMRKRRTHQLVRRLFHGLVRK